MYKMMTAITVIALNIAFSSAYAQEFSFRPSTNTYASPSASGLSPQDFANSSNKAFQEQQEKIAARVAEKAQTAEINKAKAAAQALTSKPTTPESLQKPPGLLSQPSVQQNPSVVARPTPTQTIPTQTSPVAPPPYTGFQKPPSSSGGNYNTTPSNNTQNSSGWGSNIKY